MSKRGVQTTAPLIGSSVGLIRPFPSLTFTHILRHPLQELCTSQFVPNDLEITTNSKRMNIITGPNASGKSIYIKQVNTVHILIFLYTVHILIFLN